MSKIMDTLKAFKEDTKGATAIEYSLIAALITVVILTALGLNSESLALLYNETFQLITDAINGA